MRSRSLAGALAAMVFASPLMAQTPDSSAGSQAPSVRRPAAHTSTVGRGALTLSPLTSLAAYVSGDAEFVLRQSVTLGVGGGLSLSDDFDGYRALEAKLRFYPNGTALRGFSVAMNAGVASQWAYDYSSYVILESGGFTTARPDRRRRTLPTVATDVSYQWLLGSEKRFVLVTGLGLKRFLGRAEDVFDTDFLPTARLNIGYRF